MQINEQKLIEPAVIKLPPVQKEHAYNDCTEWLNADFSRPPESAKWQRQFQQKIDDAFGAKGAIVLAWSGDQKYWMDEFYTDWYANGLPKEESLEKKPTILWATIDVNKYDYVYLYPPRWLLLERSHPEQYAPNWKASCYVSDVKMLGGKKQVRPLTPPKEYFVHWRTLGEHEHGSVRGSVPCCERHKKLGAVCFGKYRPPCEKDLIEIRKFREWSDKVKAQRADEPLTARSLQSVSTMTRSYFEQAKRQELQIMRDFALACPEVFIGTAMKDAGVTYSAREIENIIKESCNRRELAEIGETL